MSTIGGAPAAIGSGALRQTMARFATGVIVIAVGGEHVHGMTANAFSSLSLDPPLLMCCVAHNARMHASLTAERRFAVSVLGADQEHLARHFADRHRPLGTDQFAAVDWVPGPGTGAPLLSGALAWLECAVVDSHDSGDHTIFVGEVLTADLGDGGPGLLFFDGAYRRLATDLPA
jgi:flavin reductase